MELEELVAMARQELDRHGLHGWTFRLSRTRRRLGACHYQARRIEVSEYYARHNPREAVVDTLRHEIAHALAGPEARHGPAWKAVALRLGATPRACDSSDETIVAPGDWQATCPSCRKTYHRYRRPTSRAARYRCRCEARTLLVFAYAGDPAREPIVPETVADSARWEATCSGCGAVHRRVRRPRPGLWRCRCPAGCQIVWGPRADSG